MKSTKKGFTLIELIVVIAILAIIAAVAVPTAFGSIENARQAADRAQVDSVNSAIRLLAADNLLTATANKTVVDTSAATETVLKACTESGMQGVTGPITLQSRYSVATWTRPTSAAVDEPGYFVYSVAANAAETAPTINTAQQIYSAAA